MSTTNSESRALINWPRNRVLFYAIPPLGLMIFYARSIGYGYVWDDPVNVELDFAGANAWIVQHFRPLYYYSFAISNWMSDDPMFHHLVNYALMLLGVVLACRLVERHSLPFGSLVVLVVFMHPSFVYPITWISQRNDLLLIDFLLLTLLNIERSRGLVYLLLSDLSKMPFVLQNLWYATYQWRVLRKRLFANIAILVLPPIIINAYLFYAGYSTTATSALVYLDVQTIPGLATLALARLAKLLEGWFLVFIPFPGYFGVGAPGLMILVVTCYATAWTIIGYQLLRCGGLRRGPFRFLVLGAFMSLPFIFNSDMRILGPAIPFIYFGVFIMSDKSRSVKVALIMLLILNAGGSILNYRLSDTGVYDAHADVDYRQCGIYESSIPNERWRCSRSKIAKEIVEKLNALLI